MFTSTQLPHPGLIVRVPYEKFWFIWCDHHAQYQINDVSCSSPDKTEVMGYSPGHGSALKYGGYTGIYGRGPAKIWSSPKKNMGQRRVYSRFHNTKLKKDGGGAGVQWHNFPGQDLYLDALVFHRFLRTFVSYYGQNNNLILYKRSDLCNILVR